VQSRIDSVCVVVNGEGWVRRKHYPSKINIARPSGVRSTSLRNRNSGAPCGEECRVDQKVLILF
jgi:hypothetical protein